jgi:dihydrofolate reductase
MNKSASFLISAIVGIADNRVIGHNNQLPWHLPADLKHFKVLTTGHPILMGRKTYLSIGRPLPNRTNIILTRDKTFTADGIHIAFSIETALQIARASSSSEVFVIGGADIYQQLLPYTQKIYLTLIHHVFEGDTTFPQLDAHDWQEISRKDYQADTENQYDYSFVELARNAV